MKKYTRRNKSEKKSKRMLVARMRAAQAAAFVSKHEALELKERLNTVQANMWMEVVRSAAYRGEVNKLREELEKLTEPVWRHAFVYQNPPEDFGPDEMMRLWSVEGVCAVAIRVEFRHVRSLPQRDRQAYLARLVEDFTYKAREHAKRSLQVLLS